MSKRKTRSIYFHEGYLMRSVKTLADGSQLLYCDQRFRQSIGCTASGKRVNDKITLSSSHINHEPDNELAAAKLARYTIREFATHTTCPPKKLIQEVQSTLGFPLSGSRNSLSKIIHRARQAKPDVAAELPTPVQHTSQEFIEEKPNNLLAESSVKDVLRHHIERKAAFEPNEWPEPEAENFSNPGEFISIPVGNFFESLKEMISTTIEETSRVVVEEIKDVKASVKQLDRNAGPSPYRRYNYIPTSGSSYIPLEHSYGSSSECSGKRSRLTLEEYEDKKTCLKNLVISMKSLASHSTKPYNFKREINEVLGEIEDNDQSIDVDELLRAALNAFKR